jgi:hypothetical protein
LRNPADWVEQSRIFLAFRKNERLIEESGAPDDDRSETMLCDESAG